MNIGGWELNGYMVIILTVNTCTSSAVYNLPSTKPFNESQSTDYPTDFSGRNKKKQ